MQKQQTMQFAVAKGKNGVVIGRSAILQPKTNFQGGKIQWYPDKPKQTAD